MLVNAKSWLAEFGIEADDVEVSDLKLDSRKVSRGDVFIAIAGVKQHGNQYIRDALAKEATLVLTDSAQDNDSRIIVIPNLLSVLPELAEAFYQRPTSQLSLIGVTGTNGKSSTTFFINQLAQQLAIKAAVVGTLGYGNYDKLVPLSNTTPHFIDLQRMFSQLVARNKELVAIEVSSHALEQERVAGLHFAVAVFTNLTRDHLDYHGSMAAYGAAKARLFLPLRCRAAVVNVSDAFGQELVAGLLVPNRVIGRLADCKNYPQYLAYSDVETTRHGYRCRLHTEHEQFSLTLPLLGEFNIQNVLAAMASLLQLGHSLTALIDACQSLRSVPGRMEQYVFPFHVTAVVDYAHTPDALEQALKALRLHCKHRLWCVFGCGGDRDPGKRAVMGKIAESLAEHIIITADNPRNEDVMKICLDIASGMTADANYQIEPDRKAAIKLALASAQPGDVVLIAGKGHETVQVIGSEHLVYDERAFLLQLVEEMSS